MNIQKKGYICPGKVGGEIMEERGGFFGNDLIIWLLIIFVILWLFPGIFGGGCCYKGKRED